MAWHHAVDWVLLVTGYDEDVVREAGARLDGDLGDAFETVTGVHGLAFSLNEGEVVRRG